MTTALWGAASTAPMHIVHLGYALGTIVGPLLVIPFIPSNATHSANHSDDNYDVTLTYGRYFTRTFSNHDENNSSRTNADGAMTDNPIIVPYAIVGATGIIGAVLFHLLRCFDGTCTSDSLVTSSVNSCRRTDASRDEHRPSVRELLHPASCAGGSTVYGVQMFSLIILLYVMLTGKEVPIFTFIDVMAVDGKLAFSAREGALLTTMFYVAYSVGRTVVAIIGHYVPIQVLMFVEFGLMIASQVVLILVAYQSKLTFWVCLLVFAFCSGPMFPSGMSWTDRYLRMNNMAFAAITVGSSVGGFLFSWLAGYIIQYYSVPDVFYLSLACCLAAAVVMIILQVLGSQHGDRYASLAAVTTRVVQAGDESDVAPLLQ